MLAARIIAKDETEACAFIMRVVYERARIKLHEGKAPFIRARLSKRMRLHGFTHLAEYCEFVRARHNEDELTHLVDALTTNYTQFLREEDHFLFLVQNSLHRLRAGRPTRFNVWSAASSSGEEPYSIAMYLAEHYPPDHGWDWHVLGSDISTKVLQQARLGIYQHDKTENIPADWLRKYFQRGIGRWAAHVRVKPALAARVSFQHLNLMDAHEHPHSFEAIFCRNVMIYFDRGTQKEVITRLCRWIFPGGHLFVGHSESLNGLDVPLRCVRPSVYQRY